MKIYHWAPYMVTVSMWNLEFCCCFALVDFVRTAAQYGDVIMSTTASQITSLTIVYLTVYSGADQRKRQGSASLAFVRGIHRRLVNSPQKVPVTRKIFPFDDVIMTTLPKICMGLTCWIYINLPFYFHIKTGSKQTECIFHVVKCA